MKLLGIASIPFLCFLLIGQGFSQVGNYRQEGIKQLNAGQYVEALETFNLAIRTEPSSPELYFFRGYAKYALDDYLGAEEDYSRSVAIFPYQPDVFIYRAVVRSQLEDNEGAFADFARAEELDSAKADIYFNRAKLNLWLKRFNECINDCYRAIRLKYNEEYIYLLKGSAEVGLGHYFTAIASFREAMEVNPDNPYGYVQTGIAWMEMELPDSAIPFYNRALELDSLNVYALFNRSLAEASDKDFEAAIRDLDKVIRLSPFNSYAWFNRAIMKHDLGDKVGAIRDLTTVIRLNPQNLNSHYYRAMIRAGQGYYREALADLDKAIELFPEFTDAWMQRSEVKSILNDPAGAKADYDHALVLAEKNNIHPDSLTTEKKSYLESLVKLSGDFEVMNSIESRFQNQPVEIRVLPVFRLFMGKAGFDSILFYDTWQRPHYPQSIISLSNHEELFSGFNAQPEIDRLTALINNGKGSSETFLRRAIAYHSLNKFNPAFADLDTALTLDSSAVLAWFTRANTRLELIRLMESVSGAEPYITIGPASRSNPDSLFAIPYAGAFSEALSDLDHAINLDPGFPFAWYNKGVVKCAMGNYRDALGDFLRAQATRDEFPEAIYNAGLIFLYLDDRQQGCEYLSRAGELGIADAYKVMKRFCFK
jgi:tetratricopeptide (TPR) repeat protein